MPKLQWLKHDKDEWRSCANLQGTNDTIAWYQVDVCKRNFEAFIEQYDIPPDTANGELIEHDVIYQKTNYFDTLDDAKAWCENHASTLTDVDYDWYHAVN